MLFYEVIEEFNIILDPTDYVLMTIEIINLIILIIGVSLFLRKYKLKDNKFFLRIAMVFLFFFIARLFKFIQIYIIGRATVIEPYEGAALVTQIIVIVSIASAYFTIYIYLEKKAIKSTHFLLSILSIVTAIIYIVSTRIRTYEIILIGSIFGIIMSSAISIMYLILSIKSEGKVRGHTLMVAIGFLFIDLAIFLAGRTNDMLIWLIGDVSEILFSFIPLFLFLIGWILLMIGYQEGNT